jgi:predicted kinase
MKKTLVLISGSPLSGKSTLIRKLIRELKNYVVASTDETRKELLGNYEDHSREEEVWKLVLKKLNDGLKQGKITILDATLRQKDLRMNFLKEYSDCDIYYIAFEKLPLDLILERNKKRTWKQIPEDILKRLWNEYEFPTDEELKLYKDFIVVNNSNGEIKLRFLINKIK